MALYPKKETLFSIEHNRRTITVEKIAPGPTGWSHYLARVPTPIGDCYEWSAADHDLPTDLVTTPAAIEWSTGHVEARSVDEHGRRLPGDTSDADARVWAPADVKRHTTRLAALVTDAESEIGALSDFAGAA